jgi:hypothetical protein
MYLKPPPFRGIALGLYEYFFVAVAESYPISNGG